MIETLLRRVRERINILRRLVVLRRNRSVPEKLVEPLPLPDRQRIDDTLQRKDVRRQNPALNTLRRLRHRECSDIRRELPDPETPKARGALTTSHSPISPPSPAQYSACEHSSPAAAPPHTDSPGRRAGSPHTHSVTSHTPRPPPSLDPYRDPTYPAPPSSGQWCTPREGSS